MDSGKNVLIVYAHQEPRSFNGALKDIATETLRAQGHTVVVSDLYEMGFDPVASKRHFKEVKHPEHFNFQNELCNAAISNTLPDDVAEEMRKILAADLIILQFPMYWLGVPAILKGWLEMCMADKVAFDSANFKWFDNGPFQVYLKRASQYMYFQNKKAILSMTTGGTPSFFTNRGIFGDMDVLLWPIQYSLRFTGLQILSPQISYAPQDVSQEVRAEMLEEWSKRLESIWTENPLPFVHVDKFDPKKGFELTDDYVESVKANKEGPTVGQNLGKPLPQRHKTNS